MNNDTVRIKQAHLRPLKILIWLVVGCIFVCLAPFAYFALPSSDPPDPISPPATKLGIESVFDTILTDANGRWRFLFKVDNTIIATDIYGQADIPILNIVSGTDNKDAELLFDHSISPDGRWLAVIYFTKLDTSDYWHPPIGELILVNLVDGTTKKIPAFLDGFMLDWISPIQWLNPDIFLVKMHRYVGKDMESEQVTFLRYDLQDLTTFQTIAFDVCSLNIIADNVKSVLLLASVCEPVSERTVWAIDLQGKRVATMDEIEYFQHFYFDCHQDKICARTGSTEAFPTIETKRVVGDNVMDGSGKFYDHNWNRYYVYLNKHLVRVTDGGGDNFVWEPDLQLFIWREATGVFQMDDQGHYRFWHSGDYIGAFPIIDAKASP
jgi:hypothetical protein